MSRCYATPTRRSRSSRTTRLHPACWSGGSSASRSARRSSRSEEGLLGRARDHRRDRRVRRHRRHRLQRRRRRDLRLPAPLGGRGRRRRHHHVRRDVRARRGRLGEGRVRRRARAPRVLGRVRDARGGPVRQPAHACCGDRRRRVDPAASVRALVSPAAGARGVRALRGLVGDAVQLDRARLRLRRSLSPRLRRRRDQAPPGLGQRRARLRPEHGDGRRRRVRVLRRRPDRCRDDPVRGLLLFVRRGRGALDSEGPRGKPRQRADRLLARRSPVLRADDLGGRPAPAERDPARPARHRLARRGVADRASSA